MFDEVASAYDKTNDLLSLYQSRLWRRSLKAAVAPKSGERILDIAAGTGTSSMALRVPGAEVVAADFSQGMIAEGRKRYPDLEFVFADALFIGMEYADCEQAGRTDVGGWLRVPIERITVGAFWKARRVDGLVDAFSDDKFMAAFSLRARLQKSLFTELVLARDWFADSGAAGYLPSTSALLMLEANWGR